MPFEAIWERALDYCIQNDHMILGGLVTFFGYPVYRVVNAVSSYAEARLQINRAKIAREVQMELDIGSARAELTKEALRGYRRKGR